MQSTGYKKRSSSHYRHSQQQVAVIGENDDNNCDDLFVPIASCIWGFKWGKKSGIIILVKNYYLHLW